MSHILYSRGRLRNNVDHEDAVNKLSKLTKKTVEQVEERLLNGNQKRIKSSDSLEKLSKLKSKFESSGLDVFIKLNAE